MLEKMAALVSQYMWLKNQPRAQALAQFVLEQLCNEYGTEAIGLCISLIEAKNLRKNKKSVDK